MMRNLAAKTSWGDIILTLSDSTLLECKLPEPKEAPFKYIGLTEKDAPAAQINEFLQAFFSGETAAVCIKLTPAGTAFQQRVWQALQTIPRHETRSYGEIAAQIKNPRAVRAVGQACGANPLPLFIPCHRVTAKNGLGGFSGGPRWKELLLKLEGHPF